MNGELSSIHFFKICSPNSGCNICLISPFSSFPFIINSEVKCDDVCFLHIALPIAVSTLEALYIDNTEVRKKI